MVGRDLIVTARHDADDAAGTVRQQRWSGGRAVLAEGGIPLRGCSFPWGNSYGGHVATTGDIASAVSLSEKAVRLYAARGLLEARRDASNRRIFAEDQIARARKIGVLRSLGVSLTDIGRILDSEAPVEAFDSVWAAHLAEAARSDQSAAYVRSMLAGDAILPGGLQVVERVLPERLILTLVGTAALPQMPDVIRRMTDRIFTFLGDEGAPLSGPIYLEIRTRATEVFPADLRLCAPISDPIRPPADMAVVVDPAHTEMTVALTQSQADHQPLVVTVHDYLSSTARSRRGPNREVYLPSFGTGAAGPVMEVAVPVADR